MTFQRSGLTLAQLLATSTLPRTQTPPAPTANTPVVIQTTPIVRVRPWREGYRGKATKSVGKALLLPANMNHWAKWDNESLLLNIKREAIMGYQCFVVIEERYRVAKARAEELSNDNEDILRKISDVMNKVSKSKRLRFKAKEKMKAITKRVEALEKELQEASTALTRKDANLKSYVATDNAKIQEAYYQALDKLEVEAASSLRQERNVPIPAELVIIPNLEIQAIINDKSHVQGVEEVGPTTTLEGKETTSAALSSTEKPPRV
ncbi:hypothetical protein SO802_015355 [Lithocarpus litseifolius]|uniref:Uncharacterized protein n=1 Tax=Lithocarpus litseifolius TaxID=425828 RepID=A0AAW2CU40_9ROSI